MGKIWKYQPMRKTKTEKKALKALNYDLFRADKHAPPAPATLYTEIREHAERTTVYTPPEPEAMVAVPLPEVAELYLRYDQFNWVYFRGRLPQVRIEYSGRMMSAGSYDRRAKLIKIGRKYHEIFPDELNDTLKHEMIHIIHYNHNAAFKAEAARIGASVKASRHPALSRPARYIYGCPNCGMEYPRQKRLVMSSCGKCSLKGRFDVRYKLRLLRSKKRSG